MRISPIPHIDGTLWYARADVEAAIAERDAEIERLSYLVSLSSVKTVEDRPTPTLAEVAMHIMAHITPEVHVGFEKEAARNAVNVAEALLAELARRGK